jgi:hypothetical protein
MKSLYFDSLFKNKKALQVIFARLNILDEMNPSRDQLIAD